jgi:hypothetical protein
VDGGFKAAEGSAVEGLSQVSNWFQFALFLVLYEYSSSDPQRAYLSAGDCHLNLSPVRTHEHTELLYNTL